MKKDRDCGMTAYPIYPPYQNMNMGMIPPYGLPNMPMPMPLPTGMTYTQSQNNPNSVSTNTVEQQLNTQQQEINNLEKRVSTLETMFNNYNMSSYTNNKEF